ncbi:hypothetical protein N657DRAFT_648395 [Parathielavia appendiculata]|uniref:Uncharacterized protein n=1 Tax=Parathielavia appendiculata TaxID=2587402 RepID=A0AAN6TVL0_9PEZI|nr:hypothetical protein N657DRAFT_648395 [Parathielavia appendiculata]
MTALGHDFPRRGQDHHHDQFAITILSIFALLASVCFRVTFFRLATLTVEFHRRESVHSQCTRQGTICSRELHPVA